VTRVRRRFGSIAVSGACGPSPIIEGATIAAPCNTQNFRPPSRAASAKALTRP
jgi:hypothetical protein